MNLSRDIRDFLLVRKRAPLPGIGSIYLQQHSAFIEESTGRILAPGYRVLYDAEEGSIEGFINYISGKYAISFVRAKEDFLTFVRTLSESIEDNGEAFLDELGTLEKNESGAITFEKRTDETFAYGFQLPSISIQKLEKPVDQNEPVPITQAPISPSTKTVATPRMPQWMEYVLPFLIFGIIALLAYFAWNYFTSDESTLANQNIESHPMLNKDPDSVFMSDIYTKEDRDESFQDVSPQSEDDIEEDTTNPISDAITEDLVEDNTSSDLESSENNEIESTESSKESETTNEPIGSNDDETLEDNNANEAVGLVSKNIKPFQPEPFKCVIVVGSFKRQSFIDDMISKIEKSGYDYYTQAYKEFTRVGIVIECKTEAEVFENLGKIKASIEKEAWILH